MQEQKDLRNLGIQLGIVRNAVGSAYIDVGNTKIIASVYGPRKQERNEMKNDQSLNVNVRFANFARKKRSERRQHLSPEETSLSCTIVQCLSSNVLIEPQFAVDLHIHILQDDGGLVPCALTCASLALAHGKIALKDILVGASAALIDGKVHCDPCLDEQNNDKCTCLVELAYNPTKDRVSYMETKGAAEFEELKLVLSYCKEQSIQVHKLMREELMESFKQTISVKEDT